VARFTPRRNSPAARPSTLAHALRLLQENLQTGRGGPDASAYTAYALGLQSAYRERLQDMGDADGRRALGAEHLAPSCTTHFSVVDREHGGGDCRPSVRNSWLRRAASP
jgi:hypothetical protein